MVTKRVEVWTVKRGRTTPVEVTKIAVRYPDGRFHGATNFRSQFGGVK